MAFHDLKETEKLVTVLTTGFTLSQRLGLI